MTLVSPVAATPGLPTYYAIKVLGYSVDHRPIRDHRMGSPGSGIKAVVLGQMHGDEHAGVIVADTMLLGRPVKDVDLWVIPSMNPDGNAVHTRQNAHHVNLNRNWPDHWVPQGGIFYSGPAPLSEPETKAVYAFLNSVKPTLLVSIHQPLNGVDTTDGGSRNPAFAARLAHNLHLPLKPFNCWSVCRGTMTGWITDYQSGSADTVEFPANPSAAELTQVAPGGILAALGGSYDTAAAHNPIAGSAIVTQGSSVSL